MDVGEKGTVKIVSEECCEICGEIDHNHFHCPVCDNVDAGTDIYGCGPGERFTDEPRFGCEECGAEFLVLNPEALDFDHGYVYEVECTAGMVKIETRCLKTE